MEYLITISKDKKPCPLSKERMFTARNQTSGIASCGFSENEAFQRVAKRTLKEINQFATFATITR